MLVIRAFTIMPMESTMLMMIMTIVSATMAMKDMAVVGAILVMLATMITLGSLGVQKHVIPCCTDQC